MAFLTTGIIDNSPVLGVRPSSSLSVLVTNNDVVAASVNIKGYFLSGNAKIQYVEEIFSLVPGEVRVRDYYADLDGLEFNFIVSTSGVSVTLWGKDSQGNLQAAQRLVAQELDRID